MVRSGETRLRHRRVAAVALFALSLTLVQIVGSTSAEAAASEAEIVVIGGSAAVPDGIVERLASCTAGGVVRIAGADRYATAASMANEWDGADTVFLATGLNYPDALGGGPVASLTDAPILLTRKNAIPTVTSDALDRLAPNRIVLLGGTAVISSTIEKDLRARFPEVVRLSGPDRYATAAAVSRWHFTDGASTVYVATGLNYLDATVAGPPAATDNAPLLLVTSNGVPAATADELRRLGPDRIVLVGSSGVVSDAVEAKLAGYASSGVTRIAGASRYSTAAAAAARAEGKRVFVVTADSFPDGLTAAPATHGAPIVFVTRAQMNAVTADAIAARTGVACEPWTPPYPQVGSGKRIIYSNSQQRVWLIDWNEQLVDTYLVSGRLGVPYYGTYTVFSKSLKAWGPSGTVTMTHMVRFVHARTWWNLHNWGFHSIPRYPSGQPLQTEDQLGTHRSAGCVRQADHKAAALYAWTPIGTTVHAIP
ncbi:MAG: cell wall-binding repeat-containing protein [Actinomycetota bacterium]|nr:cell wall-binding repeat-containing protein [Actinomycetota bacterium]